MLVAQHVKAKTMSLPQDSPLSTLIFSELCQGFSMQKIIQSQSDSIRGEPLAHQSSFSFQKLPGHSNSSLAHKRHARGGRRDQRIPCTGYVLDDEFL